MDKNISENKLWWANLLKNNYNKDYPKEEIKYVFENNDFLNLEEDICSKLHMTSGDKLIMKSIFILLKKIWLYSIENLEKLKNNINYWEKWIEIWNIKFDRQKLIPNVNFSKKANKYWVYMSNENWIFKIQDINWIDYKLTQSAYIKECIRQEKELVLYSHIKIALQYLPWKFTENKSCLWANIFWKLLDIPLNWLIDKNWEWLYNNEKWYINTWSVYSNNSIWWFWFDNRWWRLRQNHSTNKARSCLVLYKE